MPTEDSSPPANPEAVVAPGDGTGNTQGPTPLTPSVSNPGLSSAPPVSNVANAPQVSTSFQATLTSQQISLLLNSRSTHTTRTFVKPRIGGVSPAGVWTGHGAGGQGRDPQSARCMREFNTDVVKSFTAMAPIEDKCHLGLRDSPNLLFGMPNEPNANTVVSSITAFEEQMIQHGMEAVFHIVTPDGTLNMLQEPGRCTNAIIDAWCDDLLSQGVIDPSSSSAPRLQVCQYDRINMLWSAEAMLNSCTEDLKHDLKLSVDSDDRFGPKLLMAVFTKIYRPSQSKIEHLKERLKKMSIRTYPGENVTLFVQDATKLVREIKMNFMINSTVPDLTTVALSGLTLSSDDLLLQRVRTIRINNDVNGFGKALGGSKTYEAIEALMDIDELYRVLVNQDDYSPARASPSRALQGAASPSTTLVQNRAATGGSGTHVRRCWECNSTDHVRSDCPQLQAGTTTTGSSSQASTSGSSGAGRTSRVNHGLDEATSLKVSEMAREKLLTMPSRANIPDSAQYTIAIDGTVRAKYCRHCGRFVKGASAHFTKDHTGTRNLFRYTGASGSTPAETAPSTPATATASLAGVTVDRSVPEAALNAPVIDAHDYMYKDVDYDFGFMGAPTTKTDANLCHTIMDLEELEQLRQANDDDVFFDALVKDYGG